MDGISATFMCWSGGQWRDEAPHLGVSDEASGRGRAGGVLAILVELGGESQSRDATAARLVAAVQEAYGETSGTVTLALRRAVEVANAFLYEANARVPVERRRPGGMSCALVSGGDVYVAQAGPAVVYVTQAGVLQRFPGESPWLSADPQVPVGTTWVPLGVRPAIPANLFHCSVGVEDSIALATSNLPRLIAPDDLEATLDQEPAMVMHELSALSGAGQDFSILLLQMPLAEQPPVPLASHSFRQEGRTGRKSQAPRPPAGEPHPEPEWVLAPQVDRGRLEAEPLGPALALVESTAGVVRRSIAELGVILWRMLPDRGVPDEPALPGPETMVGRKLLLVLALAFPFAVVAFTIAYYIQQLGGR